MWGILNICEWITANKMFLCGLHFEIFALIDLRDRSRIVRVLGDGESCKKEKSPAVAAGWTAPR